MASQPTPAHQGPAHNPLVSTGSSSELHVILHPLVLLTISDYIARHTLQKQEGPMVGGLLGQQNGREITIEHTFECRMDASGPQGEPRVNEDWFRRRLDQMKTVHKDRQLDFVGWYTLLPSSGPHESILGVHRFFLSNYNESSLILAFHPDETLRHTAGGKLPLTIYESNWEVEGGGKTDQDAEDKKMEDGEGGLQLKFRELAYSVETEETEMISMNYVAAGGATATATAVREEKPSRSIESNGKGKRRCVENEPEEKDEAPADDDILTRDEEETIASLMTKANAIKMLQSRINLITTYLERLPQAVINGESVDDESMDGDNTTPSLNVLRQIQALTSRLDLVIPSDKETFEKQLLQERNDVNLMQLLDQVMQSTDQAREVGKKFGIIETGKQVNRRLGNVPGAFDPTVPPAFLGR